MATPKSIIELLVAQAGGAGHVAARAMFGEYALYCDGKMVALVCDAQLFLKPTAAGRAYLGSVTEAPPYPGAKPCFLIAGEAWDDAEWLSRLFRLTAAALPMPAAKKAKGRQGPESML